MISRNKKVEEPESDSDWDSLPGDVTEPSSSPEHKPAAAAQRPSHSPVPPKQPNAHHGSAKHHVTAKPVNIYKNTLNSSQKAATTFEDRSGGLWDDSDENEHTGVKSHHPKEHSNHGNMSKASKEKKSKQHVQEQENKRPPFTDFKEALSSPIPPSQSKKDGDELSEVNQAYRIDNGDGIQNTTNHDSWDESETETISKLQHSHRQDYQREKNIATKQQHVRNPDAKRKSKTKSHKHDKNVFEAGSLALHHEQHFDVNRNSLQFENCCLVQVNHGPFDDRYRPSFFHGSKNHFHVREDDPRAIVSDFADKSEAIFQRFWREVFGVLQIVINFFAIFALELFKVIVHSLRYFISGILYITGDHLTKPLLAAVFNNIIQPFSVLLLNLFTIIRNLLKPVLEFTRELLTQISIPLRAFRIFEVNWHRSSKADSVCTDIKVI